MCKFQIAQRRQKQAAQLADQQKIEMEEESIRQQQERDKLNEQLAKKVESTTLKDSVKVRPHCIVMLFVMRRNEMLVWKFLSYV